MKRKFKAENNGIVYARWQDTKGWTEIYLKKEAKEIIEHVYEILVLEDNADLSYYLIVTVPKKRYC